MTDPEGWGSEAGSGAGLWSFIVYDRQLKGRCHLMT